MTGGDTNAGALIAAMEGMSFAGPKGTVYLRPEDHVAIQDMYIVTLLNVDSPTFEYYDIVDTVRPIPPCLLASSKCGRSTARK